MQEDSQGRRLFAGGSGAWTEEPDSELSREMFEITIDPDSDDREIPRDVDNGHRFERIGSIAKKLQDKGYGNSSQFVIPKTSIRAPLSTEPYKAVRGETGRVERNGYFNDRQYSETSEEFAERMQRENNQVRRVRQEQLNEKLKTEPGIKLSGEQAEIFNCRNNGAEDYETWVELRMRLLAERDAGLNPPDPAHIPNVCANASAYKGWRMHE